MEIGFENSWADKAIEAKGNLAYFMNKSLFYETLLTLFLVNASDNHKGNLSFC